MILNLLGSKIAKPKHISRYLEGRGSRNAVRVFAIQMYVETLLL